MTTGRPLEERLAADLSLRDPHVDPRDRALARSIATVALRRLGRSARRLRSGSKRACRGACGALEWTLVVGAAQLLFLETPDHAAVDLAVRAARADAASAPFAGARQRGPAGDRPRSGGHPRRLRPLDDDTPSWLAARWRATYGDEATRAIAAAHRCEPTLDLSVKSDAAGWAARLGGVVLPTGSVRLDTHLPVSELEGYADGEWWVQDAAAALPARLLGARAGQRVADLCAAPGGKAPNWRWPARPSRRSTVRPSG